MGRQKTSYVGNGMRQHIGHHITQAMRDKVAAFIRGDLEFDGGALDPVGYKMGGAFNPVGMGGSIYEKNVIAHQKTRLVGELLR